MRRTDAQSAAVSINPLKYLILMGEQYHSTVMLPVFPS